MSPIDLDQKITFLVGRPCSGKTKTAIETCRKLLKENWNIIYYHAEGAMEAQPTEYGVETSDQLLQMRLILDLNFNLQDLEEQITRNTENQKPNGTLVVIDTLDLFDCDKDEFISLIESSNNQLDIYFLILTNIPRMYERRHRDCAEQHIRETCPLNIDNQIIVLGNFPNE